MTKDVIWAQCRALEGTKTVIQIGKQLAVGRHVVYSALQNPTPPSLRKRGGYKRPSVAARRLKVKNLAKRTSTRCGKRKVFARGRPRSDGKARRFWFVQRKVVVHDFPSPAAISRELGCQGEPVSLATVRRDLLALGFKAFRRRKRCFLDAEAKQARVAFARRMLREGGLDSWLFTDEKWFDSDDHGDMYQWLPVSDAKSKTKRTYREVVQAPIKVMVWGCVGVGYRFLTFIRMPLDDDGRPTRLNAEGFKRQCLMKLKADGGPVEGRRLMQDGARVHWTPPNRRYAEKTLKAVPVNGWPATSPDLNPIENLWAIVAKAVSRRGPWGQDELEKYVREEWDLVPQSTIDNLVLSFRDRLKKCVSLGGEQL